MIFSLIKLSFKEPFSQCYVHFSILKPFNTYSGFHMYLPYQFMSYSGIFWSCLLPNSKYFGGKINITCLPKGYSLYFETFSHSKVSAKPKDATMSLVTQSVIRAFHWSTVRPFTCFNSFQSLKSYKDNFWICDFGSL